MKWYDSLLLQENLLWAWRKARKSYRMADILCDDAELAAFDLNLDAELESIRNDFIAGRWINSPLRLVPQPKKPDKDGRPRFRQFFQVAVRDQVAWIAICNVIGPELDRKMPAWSYGNRLYRAAWYDEVAPDEPRSHLNIGPYRHSGGNLYRHFKHSWPLYRRHISLTARKMVNAPLDEADLDAGERLALNQADGLVYLDGDHWSRPSPTNDTLYAASLDLRKFYPSIRVSAIISSLESNITDYENDPRLPRLVKQLLTFTVDDSGIGSDTKSMVDPPTDSGAYDGIPTGLFVGGFLANVAMLPLDLKVDSLLRSRRDIAHFRFVDDHEFLSYDFTSLLAWINEYADILSTFDIGAEIAPDKYAPEGLQDILHPLDTPTVVDRNELIAKVSKSAEVNGRKPTQLMTRTLGQVSMLAATDFDLLTDAGRTQRLEQLEWLLLANIPEQEIRSDTRMAFAAARIASLTPSLFLPSEKLLNSRRKLAILEHSKSKPTAQIAALKLQVAKEEREETDAWTALLRRHFALLYEAFITHPDKVRLFIRLIDFCRSTGYNGFPQLTSWMDENNIGPMKMLKCYLGSIGLQVISRHVLSASVTIERQDLLHRERDAARSFLNNLLSVKIDHFVPLSRGRALDGYQVTTKASFTAALLLASTELRSSSPKLATSLTALARKLKLGERIIDISDLAPATGIPIGVWCHWFLSSTGAHPQDAPTYWTSLASLHDPSILLDWNSLRRYPKTLPSKAWDRIHEDSDLLKLDDAGWLLEAARTAGDRASMVSSSPPMPVVQTHLRKMAGKDWSTLSDWTGFVRSLKPADPRRSEWTSLEIVFQILRPFLDLGGPELDRLDDLNPENIRIPESWYIINDGPKIADNMTWEGWRKLIRTDCVSISSEILEDYRFSEMLGAGDKSWARRLRPIGQLLWGLLRHSFSLPSAWNIRGQERSLFDIVARELERLPISSFTLSILQSCLLPRSRETSLLIRFPLLFGNLSGNAANDAEFESPIYTLEQLESLIKQAQQILESSQMTVLEHEPRQLIPVKLRQIGVMNLNSSPDPDLLA